ncbi:hypothetical protein AB0I90_26860 [Micromonospora wenchangensis]|uniref:hypothetical protein n=1 Tax=Micromonospora wenchangensis TaxID=1185415 RepID=UPI00340E82B5
MTSPRPQQWFHFGPWVFSIHAAEALIAAQPRDTRPIDVPSWAAAFGLTHLDEPHRSSVSLIGPTSDGLDRVYAMSTDLAKPIIVAQPSVNGHPPAPLLIDGAHRLYRAWRKQMPQLPTWLLTPEETLLIRHNTVLGPGHAVIIPPSV